MDAFTIHLPLESYIHDGKIDDFGKVHLQLGEYVFPDKEWTDFGLIIIHSWMDAFLNLLSKKEKKVECDFMDGNYRFDVEVTGSPKVWRIYLIREWTDSEEVKNQGEIAVKQATDELLRVVGEIKDMDRNAGKAEYVKNIENYTQQFLLARQKMLATVT